MHGVGLLAGLFSGNSVALFITLAPEVLLIFALGAWVHWCRALARASAHTRNVLAIMAVSLPITLPGLTLPQAMTLTP